jgi:hypothetical protein
MRGDFNWGLKTKGDLNLLTKIYFTYDFIRIKYSSKKAIHRIFEFAESDFIIPDSVLVNQTIEFLKDTHQVFLINHCFRTYHWQKRIYKIR